MYCVKRWIWTVTGAAILLAVILSTVSGGDIVESDALSEELEAEPSGNGGIVDPGLSQEEYDVIMTIKSSRPGCEEDDSCYEPAAITVEAGQPIVWKNDDVAFHSVTSGLYDAPLDLFDSGHLDPDEIFTVTLEEPGRYDYFCTLHPWMDGVIIVLDKN